MKEIYIRKQYYKGAYHIVMEREKEYLITSYPRENYLFQKEKIEIIKAIKAAFVELGINPNDEFQIYFSVEGDPCLQHKGGVNKLFSRIEKEEIDFIYMVFDEIPW